MSPASGHPRASLAAEDTPGSHTSIPSQSALPEISAEDLLNGITDGFVLIDAQWRVAYLNEAAKRMLRPRKDPDTVLGRGHWEAFPDTLGSELERQYRAVAETRAAAFFDFFYEAWQRWFELRVFPWSQGGIVVFFHDVSERKLLETELRAKERSLRVELAELEAIYQRAPLGLAALDLDLRFLRINERLAEINGVPAAAHIGKTVQEIVPSLWESVVAVRDQVVKSGESVRVEFSGMTDAKPGVVRHWLETWYPIFGDQGKIVALGAVVEEIPERQIAERKFFRQALQLADVMPQLVWTADSAGVVDYYNERLSEYGGAKKNDDGSWLWEPMLHPDDAEPTWKAWRDAVASSHEYRMIHRVRMVDGKFRWHLSRAIPLKAEDGRVLKWFGTATDIDEQKQIEQKLEAAVAARTKRLEETIGELEAFSYSVSHDMRGPLRSMQTYARILQAEGSDNLNENCQHFVQRIIASADRLDRLIQDVLAFSQVSRGSLPMETVIVEDLIDEIIASYPDLTRVEIVVPRPLPRVHANRAALTQCLSNLLSNAVRFINEGTVPRVQVSAHDEGGTVVIRISDNGYGIAASDQSRIFDLFFQARRGGEGTGIGLAIVKRAAERMGGKVLLESTSASGSTFALYLRAPGA